MAQQFNNAKDNPSHKNARVWLTVGHLTPKQVAQWLPFVLMDMGDLRVPKRRGRQKGRTAASTLEMAEQLAKRIADTGELPTTAARRLLAAYGFRGPTSKAGPTTWCGCGKIALLNRANLKRATNSISTPMLLHAAR